MKRIIKNDYKDRGRFLLWTWELWEIGGGAGVIWNFLKWQIYPGRYNILWVWFKIQRRKK
jgi:hypothetical protein